MLPVAFVTHQSQHPNEKSADACGHQTRFRHIAYDYRPEFKDEHPLNLSPAASRLSGRFDGTRV